MTFGPGAMAGKSPVGQGSPIGTQPLWPTNVANPGEQGVGGRSALGSHTLIAGFEATGRGSHPSGQGRKCGGSGSSGNSGAIGSIGAITGQGAVHVSSTS